MEFCWLRFWKLGRREVMALKIPTTKLNIKELEWHLDCPFWVHDNGERYTVTPRDVLEKEEGTQTEQDNVENANTLYPIDIYFNKDKWLILDGIHRLVKLYKENVQEVDVRIVTDKQLPRILSGDLIEIPSW